VDDELERLHLAATVGAGTITIRISFSGAFNDQLVGFYLSRFTDADGKEAKLATTQFEATHARKAFPCWDEPAHKAVFELEILAPMGCDAIANQEHWHMWGWRFCGKGDPMQIMHVGHGCAPARFQDVKVETSHVG